MMFSTISYAADCGSGTSQSVTTVSEVLSETKLPKWLEGSKITITKADGTSETVSSEEYMVVPRKHKRPIVQTTNTETMVVCKKVEDKNIISVNAKDGFDGSFKSSVKTTATGTSATIEMEKKVMPGIGYQRKVGPVWLGVDVNTGNNVGASVGVGF